MVTVANSLSLMIVRLFTQKIPRPPEAGTPFTKVIARQVAVGRYKTPPSPFDRLWAGCSSTPPLSRGGAAYRTDP